MTFNEIIKHCEKYGCVYDHLEGSGYWFENQFNNHGVIIEDIDDYTHIAICHYCYELGIPSPFFLREQMNNYRDFRDTLFADHDIKTCEQDDADSGYFIP